MANVHLLLGSNLNDRFSFIERAINYIEQEIGMVLKQSGIYESAPWGFESDQNFLNSVLIVSSSLLPNEVLLKIKKIEKLLGRIRNNNGYSSRTIDIDILFYDDLIYNKEDLTIPHPQLEKRRFTLVPLEEVAAEFIHPIIKRTVKKILEECKDDSAVYEIRQGLS
jgi:2-amino-4-hydroxy-6-hydroxymethyldihydropteridine diphosphokinase